MKAEDKARQLVQCFYNTEHCHKKHFPNNKWCDCSEMGWFQAKQCALFAVDQIINVVSDVVKINYWLRVKNHIKDMK